MLIKPIEGTSKPLVKILHRQITQDELCQTPNLFPVRITKGALGAELPKRDLLVSHQHRMLVSSPIVNRMFNVPEVLIAAIRLIDLPGIFADTSVQSVCYYHLVFEQHQVIFAQDAPAESLFLAVEPLKTLPPEAVMEL